MLSFDRLGDYNIETLTDELRLVWPADGNAVGCKSYTNDLQQLGVTIIAPDNTTDAEIDVILSAHNPSIFTTEQEEEANSILIKSVIRDYLKRQLVKQNPNVATIKTTIESAIAGNANIQQAMVNIAALKGYNLTTNTGYIAACIDTVSIFS